ncbi:MAG: leucine-rich repeat protein [Muribaculaceae bacterium]|nr:leucine-rich repeat protein [Muribaculaceae bacterium]
MKNCYLLKLFVLTLCLWCAMSASAYDFAAGGFYYNIKGSNQVEVTYENSDYASYSGVVNIPSQVTYNGTTYTVSSIGYQAFTLSTITQVTIPNTVTRIGSNAFRICKSLEKVTMTDAVTQILSQAFEGCRKLKEINLSENLENLPFSCFSWCDSLKSITLPHSLKTIGSGAFKESHNLKAITCMAWEPPTLDDGTVFESDVLSSATLTVPKSSFNDYKNASSVWSAFSTIKSLYYDIEKDGIYYLRNDWGTLDVTYKDNSYNSYSGRVVIPSWITLHEGDIDVEGIGSCAFLACRNLTSVSLNPYIKIIRDRAFMHCTALTSISIPSYVETIENYAFSNCVSLNSITLREGLKTIGSYAMSGIGLTSITLPASLESIDGNSLSANTSLPTINVKADNPNFVSINGVLFTRDGKKLLTYPAGKSSTTYTVPDGIEVIANNAFDRARLLTEINLPNTLKQVLTSAFRECNALQQMVYPRGVTRINNSAMDNCNSMTSVTLPSTLTYLGSNVFYRCTSLNNIYVKAVTPPTCDIYEWYDYDWDEYVTDYTFTNAQFTNATLYVPTQSLSAYRNADTWKKFNHFVGVDYAPDYIPGDVNSDNTVSISDVTALINYLLTDDASSINIDAADFNEDSRVSIDDVTALINYLLTAV